MTTLHVYPIGDLRIQVELQDRLQRAERLAGSQIDVYVNEGAVTLEGRVFCKRDATEAVRAAAEVAGVTDIHDDLLIEVPAGV